MRALHEIERHRPQAHLAGDAVLWTDAAGVPLAVTPVAPSGRKGLWDAMVRATVPPATPAERAALAFAAALGPQPLAPAAAEVDHPDLDEELATLAFLARLPA